MKSAKKFDPIYIILSISIILISYVGFRAIALSFTHDESFSYLHWMSRPIVKIFTFGDFQAIEPANNHILNTLLMKLSSNLFGASEFSLRLFSVLAYILYLFASYKLVYQLRQGLAIIGFLLLNCNPYLLDFFSLSRGYSLALAFMLLSLVFLKNGLERKSIERMLRQFLLALGTAGIACLANLTFLYFYVALVGTIIVYLIIFYRQNFSSFSNFLAQNQLANIFNSKNIPFYIYSVAAQFYLVPTVIRLRTINAFSYGGEKGFIPDTMYSLVKRSLYDQGYFEHLSTWLCFSIIILMAISTVIFIFGFIQDKFSGRAFLPLAYLSITWFITFLSLSLNATFHIKFLVGRTAILFLPLLALILIYLFDYLLSYKPSKAYQLTAQFIILLTTSAVVYHTLNSANLSYSLEWRYDSDTKAMIQDLQQAVTQESGTNLVSPSISLGISGPFEPTINFYKKIYKLSWLKNMTRDNLKETNDYYFYLPSDQSLVQNRPILLKKKYEAAGNMLSVQEPKSIAIN